MQTLQLIVSLSILVLIHELGHFTFAKLFGARVDKFYLFFNPWFSIFKFKKGDTTYGLGWLPFGGYCKIAGMIDESMDKDQLKQAPQPWEYRSKTVWQRFFIISGGVIFNFILALIIYSGMLYTWGETYLPNKNAHYGIYCDSLALSIGLQHGDKIIKVDNTEPERFSDIHTLILLDNAKTITVDRKGIIETITIPKDFNLQIIAQQNPMFIVEFIPFFIDSVIPGTPAYKAELKKNDRILAIDSIPTPTFIDFVKHIKKYANKQINLTILRNGYKQIIPLTVSPEGTIGAYRKELKDIYTFETRSFSILSSIPAGIHMGVSTLVFYIKQMKFLFTKEGSQQVGSFLSMGKLYDTGWNWQVFWSLTALFSVILAFMNILPIPALDGGHLLFILYEMITGKKPSDTFLERAQMIGMTIVLTIFVYAIVMDIGRLFE
ncbi:MAG TPA: RIP metalloprotease RseP [Bacteroidales bacterium]|nr:RIP metalloprotease RseP [Bacteroidales bacterium]